MTKNRQAVADALPFQRSNGNRMATVARAWARRIIFSIPLFRRYFERRKVVREDAKRWNALIAETNHETYLGGTINVDSCNLMAAMLIKYRAPISPTVLDIGCCGGTLISCIHSFRRYLGIDISDYAIGEAMRDRDLQSFIASGQASFKATDLRNFSSTERWDVIVFNEVLYYLACDEAIAVCERYSQYLTMDGVILIAMKDDAKSRAIFKGVNRSMSWLDGMLWQRKASRPDYRIRVNRERPAALLGVFARDPNSLLMPK